MSAKPFFPATALPLSARSRDHRGNTRTSTPDSGIDLLAVLHWQTMRFTCSLHEDLVFVYDLSGTYLSSNVSIGHENRCERGVGIAEIWAGQVFRDACRMSLTEAEIREQADEAVFY